MRHRRNTFTHGWKHSPFALTRSEIEEKVDNFGWPSFETHGVWGSAAWAPDLDLFVRNNQLIARMDLPGLTKENVAIEVGDGELTIRGTRSHEPETCHDHTYRCACEFGSFFRTVPLPEGVDREFLLHLFLAREASASTAIGDGIAIPHVRNPIALSA